ncbi:MAG TPA: FemAB family XrtA/PEP-CTERM system-associated protein [Gemmatimonadaceae bacterium]
MRIIQIRDDDAKRWDEYVRVHTGTVTDLYAWREIVREAYGLQSFFLAAMDEDHTVGTLGLFEIKHPIFGHYLTTAVFGNDGGLHFDDTAARDALLAEARDLADRVNAEYLLIRTRDLELDGFRVDRNYRTAVIDLDGGGDAVWNRLPAKTRNQVRRGLKEGFTVETGHDQLKAFYRVFHQHMRDLGSPAHGRKYYEAIVEHLGDCADFLVVRDGATVVAGALLFWVNGTAMNYHTVALREYNRRCPNYLLYWRMIEVSCKRGCTRFDMGRSRFDSSNLQFKENWNPQEVPLSYNYYLRKLKDIPSLDPRNPKYRLQIALWKKMPLFVTRALGPRLISGLA